LDVFNVRFFSGKNEKLPEKEEICVGNIFPRDSHTKEIVKKWMFFSHAGFEIRYPFEWIQHYTPEGQVELLPDWNPSVFDSGLKIEVANPGVNITTVYGKNPLENMVERFIEQRPNGYEGYKQIQQYDYEIRNVTHSKLYEFQYGDPGTCFQVMSLVAQKNLEMFVVTAFGTCYTFNEFRQIIEGIIYSFQVL